MQVKVSVIGHLNNRVSVFQATVEISQQSHKRGLHHDDAVELAEASGYSGPFLTLSEEDDLTALQSAIDFLKGDAVRIAA